MNVTTKDYLDNNQPTMRIEHRCRKCGERLDPEDKHIKLRCDTCIKFVDAELKGGISRPLQFYFDDYRKHGRKNTGTAPRANHQIHRKSYQNSRGSYGRLG